MAAAAAAAIKTVGVVSTGVIGSSFVALCLARGLHVRVCSPSVGAEERLTTYLRKLWPTLDAQIGLSPGASLDNWRFVGPTLDGHFNEIDFIQENAPERVDLKTQIFAALDAGARPGVVIASSSSGLPASRFISGCARAPERVLVGHVCNPPHLVPLVEVVPHPGTSTTAAETALALYRRLGKSPVLVRRETPGFVANRLQAVVLREAYSLVARGIVTAEELDLCITQNLGPRWAYAGPFMTNVMQGGGGNEGFARLGKNYLPALLAWLADIRANEAEITPELVDVLNKSVQQMLDARDMEAFQRDMAAGFTDLLKMKERAVGLKPRAAQKGEEATKDA